MWTPIDEKYGIPVYFKATPNSPNQIENGFSLTLHPD